MLSFSRRAFLGASLAGLASGRILGADKPLTAVPISPDDAPFQPSTLFLTWQRDPTTTMTVQWIGAAGETPDANIYYAPARSGIRQVQPTAARPYPMTDLKVFRAEITGLTPGTDYRFRIGKQSPTYRFRTMPAKASDTI